MSSSSSSSSSSSIGTRRFFCIEYPGYVQNTEKAIECLGGKDTINKVVNEHIKYLDVNYRKNDSFSHPLYADYLPSPNRVLIKIVRKKRKKKAEGENDGGGEEEEDRDVRAEILGPVTHSVQFVGLSDFQLQTKFSAAAREEDVDELELAPLIFSRFDYVRDYRFMNHIPNIRDIEKGQEQLLNNVYNKSKGSNKGKTKGKQAAVVVGSDEESDEETFVRSTRRKRQTFLEYSAAVPSGPLTGSYPASKSAKKHPIVQKLRQKFATRPIWSKAGIRLALSEENALVIARHLAVVAYRFSGGPWRNFWIRYGYDPRIDPGSRIYQSIDFRMPPEKLALLGVSVPDRVERPIRKRQLVSSGASASAAATTLTAASQSGEVSATKKRAAAEKKVDAKKDENELDGNISEHDEDDVSEKDEDDEQPDEEQDEDEEGGDYLYFSRLPTKPSTTYQLCDLEGEEIQKMLRSCPPTAQCTQSFGWYPKTVMAKLRSLMKEKVDKWLQAYATAQHDSHEVETGVDN